MSKPDDFGSEAQTTVLSEGEAQTTVLSEVEADTAAEVQAEDMNPASSEAPKKKKKKKEKQKKVKAVKSGQTKDENGDIRYVKKKRSWKERLSANLFVGPSFIGVMIFFIVPSFVVLYYANIDSIIGQNFVGIKNFSNVLSNSSFQTAAKNTAIFSLLAVPLAIVLSLLMALLLEHNIPLKSTFRTFFLSPLMVPVASVVLIWRVLFENHGAINDAIMAFGGNPVDWFKSDYSQLVIVILFLWKNLGYNMILFMAALSAIPKDVLEVATLDGASSWKQFWSIKLRYILPTVFFVGIMSLINSFKVFREVYLLTGDYPFKSLYMLQHFMNNTFKSLDYQKLSAAAIIMCAVMIVIIGLLFIVENKMDKDVEG